MQCIKSQRDKRSLVSGVETDDIKCARDRRRQGWDNGKAPLHVRLVECLTAMSMFGNGAVLQHP